MPNGNRSVLDPLQHREGKTKTGHAIVEAAATLLGTPPVCHLVPKRLTAAAGISSREF